MKTDIVIHWIDEKNNLITDIKYQDIHMQILKLSSGSDNI